MALTAMLGTSAGLAAAATPTGTGTQDAASTTAGAPASTTTTPATSGPGAVASPHAAQVKSNCDSSGSGEADLANATPTPFYNEGNFNSAAAFLNPAVSNTLAFTYFDEAGFVATVWNPATKSAVLIPGAATTTNKSLGGTVSAGVGSITGPFSSAPGSSPYNVGAPLVGHFTVSPGTSKGSKAGIPVSGSVPPLATALGSTPAPGYYALSITLADDDDSTPAPCSLQWVMHVAAPSPPTLSITKSASVSTVAAGGSFNYTLVATNKGPGDATNAVVTDTIPAGLKVNSTPTSSVGSCGSGTSSSVSCNLGTLAQGASATITVNVTADGTVCGPVNNTGQVTASNSSPANSNQVTVMITCPNFSITLSKATSATQVTAGQGFTYTLVATNTGGAPATNVVVKDSIPAKLGISGTPTSTLGSCSVSGNDVTCSLGTLAAANSGGANSATIRIDVTTTTASCGTVDNMGTVSANGGSTGNSNTVTTTIVCPTPGISVSVVKTNNAADPTGSDFRKTETEATASETFTYRAVITNTSLVTEVIGTATDVIAGQPSQDVCGDLLNTTLAPGASVTCTFPGVGPASGGTIETDTVTTPVSQQGNPTNTASATDTSNVLPPVLGTVITPPAPGTPAPATLAFTGAPVGKLAASAVGMIALGLLLLFGMQLIDEPRRLRLRPAAAGGRSSAPRPSPGRTDPPSRPWGRSATGPVSGYQRTAPAMALTWACDRFRDRFSGRPEGPAPPPRR